MGADPVCLNQVDSTVIHSDWATKNLQSHLWLLPKAFWETVPRWSVQFISAHSLSHVYLWPHGLQHPRPPCPSPTPKVYSNSCALSRWCHSTIASSVVPFSSCSQSFPASGSFQMSQFFTSGGQNTGVSASASVLPMNNQDWFPLGWPGWTPWGTRDSQESSPTPQSKSINFLMLSFLYSPTLTSTHDYWRNHSFD